MTLTIKISFLWNGCLVWEQLLYGEIVFLYLWDSSFDLFYCSDFLIFVIHLCSQVETGTWTELFAVKRGF